MNFDTKNQDCQKIFGRQKNDNHKDIDHSLNLPINLYMIPHGVDHLAMIGYCVARISTQINNITLPAQIITILFPIGKIVHLMIIFLKEFFHAKLTFTRPQMGTFLLLLFQRPL